MTFAFKGSIDGRFVVELEGHGEQIAELDVAAVRRRLALAAALALSAALALPASALAHGLVGKQDLPIPRWLFAWARRGRARGLLRRPRRAVAAPAPGGRPRARAC